MFISPYRVSGCARQGILFPFSGEEYYTACETGPIVDGMIDRVNRRITYRLLYQKTGCEQKSFQMRAELDERGDLINGVWTDEATLEEGDFSLYRP